MSEADRITEQGLAAKLRARREAQEERSRVDGLDVWRSAAVVLMIVYHLLYDLEHFGVIAAGTIEHPLLLVLRWVCAGSFILISGAAVRFSRNPLLRGFAVMCIGLAVSIVTTLLHQQVLFGILQFLGICMMVCGLLDGKLRFRRGPGFVAVCAVLFAVTLVLTKNTEVNIRFLFPLGLKYRGFYSADYYPILPWVFLFMIGTAMGDKLLKQSAFQWFPRWATFLGRHSLLIYVLHQPILYGLAWWIFG